MNFSDEIDATKLDDNQINIFCETTTTTEQQNQYKVDSDVSSSGKNDYYINVTKYEMNLKDRNNCKNCKNNHKKHEMVCQMKNIESNVKCNELNESVEVMRSDADDWQHIYASTSTPTTSQTNFPDLNISSISVNESNDSSNMLFEKQMSRFQISTEKVDSLVLANFDSNEDIKILKHDLNLSNG